MKIISHRGNLEGPDLSSENKPSQIIEALKLGFDVEIDVWNIDDHFFLGHDQPSHKIDSKFLLNDKLWCHAKNLSALEKMLKMNLNCFWHQEDDFTVTSKGFIWINKMNDSQSEIGISCIFKNTKEINGKHFAICTDFPLELKKVIS